MTVVEQSRSTSSPRGRSSQGLVGMGAALCLFSAATATAAPSELAPEVGYAYGEVETARAASLAGATRAVSSSIEALYANPANLAATRVYHLAGTARFWSAAGVQSYGAAVVDSIVSRSRLAGGLGVTRSFQDPDGVDRDALDVRFALALPLAPQLLVGASGHYVELEQGGLPRQLSGLPPSVFSAGLRGDPMLREVTFDAGLALKPTEGFSLSLVGYNLTNPGHALLPFQVGGGLGVGSGMFSIEGDVVFDFTTYESTKTRAMAGAEVLLGGSYPLRLGFAHDEGMRSDALCGGVGYVQREFGLDLSLRRHLGAQSNTALFITLRYHLESSSLLPDGGEF